LTTRFNYIVPIFNKEDVLPATLAGIDECASADARIFTVIDGCTDRSESVVDDFIARTGRRVEKLHMPNVHMLRSVNAALAMVEDGFTVVMQDDIVLDEKNLEANVLALYERMGPRLGVISGRLAANVTGTPLHQRIRMGSLKPMIKETDFLQSPDNTQDYPVAAPGAFYPRMAAINGPNVIPPSVRERVGLFDDGLAPYGYDDPEYCLRAMKAGFINGLFPIRYRSDLEWGGTRRSRKFRAEARRIHRRNRIRVSVKHRDYVAWLWRTNRVARGLTPVESLAGLAHVEEGTSEA
jgi:GT2 family glycosyltransferase